MYDSNVATDSNYTRKGRDKGERGTDKRSNKHGILQYLQEHKLTYHKHGSFSDSFSASSPCFWYILLCAPIPDTSENCPYRLENKSVSCKYILTFVIYVIMKVSFFLTK